jgi:hypothetical protein
VLGFLGKKKKIREFIGIALRHVSAISECNKSSQSRLFCTDRFIFCHHKSGSRQICQKIRQTALDENNREYRPPAFVRCEV